jgi:hypothetical protein
VLLQQIALDPLMLGAPRAVLVLFALLGVIARPRRSTFCRPRTLFFDLARANWCFADDAFKLWAESGRQLVVPM